MAGRIERAAAVLAAGFCVATGMAQSGPVKASYPTPSLDRWMYPFNATPGSRALIPTFGALGLAGFDDRDAQFLAGFEGEPQIPSGQGANKYRIAKAVFTATVAEGGVFVYDPTPDALETYYDPNDPQYVPDSDPGRPIELFGTGYRNGFTLLTFKEDSPFGGVPLVPPAEGARNAFAAVLDSQGTGTDASRNVRLREEAPGIAVGVAPSLSGGDTVPPDTEFTFEIDLCATGVKAYLAQSLDAGMVHLTVTSLHMAQPGGPATYPIFYSKENAVATALGYAATLELTVVIDDDADLNGDGVLDLFDFLEFTNLFNAGDPLADYTDDCTLDLFDFLAFVNAFNK